MTEQWKTLASVASQDVVDALREAYRVGLNAGLANKLTEGTFEWAMQQMRQGTTVTRRWKEALKMKQVEGGGIIAIGENTNLIATADIIAEDWEIAPEPKPEPEGWRSWATSAWPAL